MEMFEKVVKFKKPEKLEEKIQQVLFETEEKYVPKKLQDTLNFLNQKMSNQQKTLEEQNQQLKEQSSQNKRLANSIEALIPEMHKIRVNDESASVNFSTNPEAKDLACYDLKAPSEAKYPLSSCEIGDKIGISSASQVGRMMKELNLKNDYLFHLEFKQGRNGKIQKYAYAVIPEIFKRLDKPQNYEISENIAIFWRQRVKNIPNKD